MIYMYENVWKSISLSLAEENNTMCLQQVSYFCLYFVNQDAGQVFPHTKTNAVCTISLIHLHPKHYVQKKKQKKSLTE